MKRLAWIILAIACTFLVRVEPVDVSTHCVCRHCHCGTSMPCAATCALSRAPAPGALTETSEVRAASSAPAPARRMDTPLFSFDARAASAAHDFAPDPALEPPAEAPLYRVHCSFLI